MLLLKQNLLRRITLIEDELKDLKDLVSQLDSPRQESPKGVKKPSRITQDYVNARDWARKTLKLKL